MQALYSGVFSENPVSWIKDFKLGVSVFGFSDGETISNCFVPVMLAFCIALIGAEFPRAVANVACLALVDFLVAIAGGVFFLVLSLR